MVEELLRQTQSLSPTCRRGEGFASDVQVDDGSVTGQAAPFGKWAELRPGLFERFERGAFHAQVRDPARVKLCLEHGQVIGKCSDLWETENGLQFRAAISGLAGIPEAARARAMLDDGLVDELSVGFSGVKGGMDVERRDDGSTLVTHRRARLMEISLVPWGVYGRDAVLQRSRLVDPEVLRRAAEVEARRAEARAWVERFATLRD